MTVEVYIQGQKLDLFDDESINVTQSVQDVNDISKVFGDYSQTFSVPASARNDHLLAHRGRTGGPPRQMLCSACTGV